MGREAGSAARSPGHADYKIHAEFEMERRRTRKGDDLARRLIQFAARVGKVVDALPDTRLGRHIAGQLVRCGTSPAPNYAEARGAESKKDFIHKMGICEKELRESQCWLELIICAELLPESKLTPLLDESDELIAIVVRSIDTARKRKPRTEDHS